MNDHVKTDVYTCKKCNYKWLQRHKVILSTDDSIQEIISKRPKNCSRCKSKSWYIPRS